MSSTNALKDVSSLLTSEKYSDLTITCGDQTFKVHRAVVCTQSQFFSTACDGGFQEAIAGVINLPDDDPDDIERLISFFYTGDYEYEPDPPVVNTVAAEPIVIDVDAADDDAMEGVVDSSPSSTSHELCCPHCSAMVYLRAAELSYQMAHISMYAIGEKFIVPELKELALEKFQQKDDFELWMHGIGDLIRSAYTTTPSTDRGMRDLLAAACADFNIEDDEDYQQALVEIPEAHVDILKEKLVMRNRQVEHLNEHLVTATRNETKAKDEVREAQAILNATAADMAAINKQNQKLVEEKQQLEIDKRILKARNSQLREDKAELKEKLSAGENALKTEEEFGEKKLKNAMEKIHRGECGNCHQRLNIYVRQEEMDRDYHEHVYVKLRCGGCHGRIRSAE